MEGNAKCRHLKKLTCKGDFAAGVYLSEAQNPIPPPLTHCIRVFMYRQYTYSPREGREGVRVGPEKRLEGQHFTKLGRKYQHCFFDCHISMESAYKIKRYGCVQQLCMEKAIYLSDARFRIHRLHLLGDQIGNAEGRVSLKKRSVNELNKNLFFLNVQQLYMPYAWL
jgi:hypothetical protein